MGSFDVISSYHVIPAAGTGVAPLADVVQISGRVRLFHVWVTGGAIGIRNLIFRNGSSSADIILRIDSNFTNWPATDNNNPIPGGGIVFDGGMYFDPQNGATATEIQTATFIYQVG